MSEDGSAVRPTFPAVSSSNGQSYAKLRKELSESLSRLPIPRSKEDYDERRQITLKMLSHRRDLLFSIPISPKAENDRNEAWKVLEVGTGHELGGYFNSEQDQYAKNLLKSYSSAPQVEKLVIWDVIRTRMEYLTQNHVVGTSVSDQVLKNEMAKLLFSALGIDEKELLDAASMQQRKMSDAAWSKGIEAAEKIVEFYNEQSKVAEKILEKNWKLPP